MPPRAIAPVGAGGAHASFSARPCWGQSHWRAARFVGAATRTVSRPLRYCLAAVCSLLGTGVSLGLSGIAGEIVITLGLPFRMVGFAALVGILGVVLVSVAAAVVSVRPVIRLPPAVVFSGRCEGRLPSRYQRRCWSQQ